MSAPGASGWTPYDKLTDAPTNLKEAIDWVLRVTGRDGKKNEKTAPAAPKFGCLCFIAKAVKDLLYDARSPGSPGPSPKRYWDDLLLGQEKDIVKPVLTDLGLLSGGTSAATSTTYTCAGGTEVIRALIDQLALGLQKWVGWQDGEEDKCCLLGEEKNRDGNGIGKRCDHGAAARGDTKCCTKNGANGGSGGSNRGGTPCASHECKHCGISPDCNTCTGGKNKCYLSAYKRHDSTPNTTPTDYLWPTISSDPSKVHLLARIFLGSVCLIWSGLSQLGFLTGNGSSRWKDSKLHEVDKGLGSFMAAMGYDLDRLNQGKGKNGGEFVHELLTGKDKDKGVPWKEFTTGASKGKNTEEICTKYPLLVLHILASGYFRAGSAGANKVTVTASPATEKKETPSSRKPRHPRTIREILYWLSALPYSQGYKDLVDRMQQKYPPKDGVPNETVDQIELYDTSASKASTTLQRKDITHYLMAACGYCPLVLIGIQGTIEREVKAQATVPRAQQCPRVVMWTYGGVGGNSNGNNQGGSPNQNNGQSNKNKCPNHSKDRNKRCTLDKKDTTAEAVAQVPAAPAAPAPQSNGQPLEEGQVCYGGYHLEVSKFGPLHGMYANGLFGFDMEGSPAQCLDQLRIYVYHCFYQLYFLRKQCSAEAVLGWQSLGTAGDEHAKSCGISDGAGGNVGSGTKLSPLMSFLCDALGSMVCDQTRGKTPDRERDPYPSIEDHMNKTVDHNGKEQGPHKKYPELCPVPMGWDNGKHFKGTSQYPMAPLRHCIYTRGTPWAPQ
uniref:Variant erythrocyte surface antigen-1, putative n=1 Tax=Babesia bovis TaxID=5865 RepID=A7AXH4_BABBO|eukprot:XP_001608628.1 variant erythrocyte surface antigen-1 [Babesia bovis T2Bo]